MSKKVLILYYDYDPETGSLGVLNNGYHIRESLFNSGYKDDLFILTNAIGEKEEIYANNLEHFLKIIEKRFGKYRILYPKKGRKINTRNFITEARGEHMEELREEGLSLTNIAIETGCSRSTVVRYFKRKREEAQV